MLLLKPPVLVGVVVVVLLLLLLLEKLPNASPSCPPHLVALDVLSHIVLVIDDILLLFTYLVLVLLLLSEVAVFKVFKFPKVPSYFSYSIGQGTI